jgi:hypothetical protein
LPESEEHGAFSFAFTFTKNSTLLPLLLTSSIDFHINIRQNKMQFSLIAILAIATTAVFAGPVRMRRGTCDIKTCVLDLAPTGVACAAAAAQAAADPISDAGCIIAALKDVDELPTSCDGCADQLGISSALESAKNAIEGIF